MGGPLNAVLWLARKLQSQGRSIEAGGIVCSGSCTMLAQVVAGQRIEMDFGGHSRVTTRLM